MRSASVFPRLICTMLVAVVARATFAQTVSPGSITVHRESAVCASGSETLRACIALPPGAIASAMDIFFLSEGAGPDFIDDVTPSLKALAGRLATVLPGVELGVGVGSFDAFGGPGLGYSGAGDTGRRAFILYQPIVTAATAGGAAARDMLVNEALGFAVVDLNSMCGRSYIAEALYRAASGAGFDGDGDGLTTGIGGLQPAGLAVSPDASGDVPAFATLAPGVVASGRGGGAGFRSNALKLIIVATDKCSIEAFSGSIPASIAGTGGTVPTTDLSCLLPDPCGDRVGFVGNAKASMNNTVPAAVAPSGASTLPETIEALNAAGIRVLGVARTGPQMLGSGPSDDEAVFLSAVARLTGAVDATGTPLVVPGRDGVAALTEAVVRAVTRPVGITLTAGGTIPAGLSLSIAPPDVPAVGPGGEACFDVTLASTTAPAAGDFALEFKDSNAGALLGTIPIAVDCGACDTAQACDDGNPCTDDACTGGRCVYTDNTAACNDGDVCNGADVCRAGSCVPVGALPPPCPTGALQAFIPNFRNGTVSIVDVERDKPVGTPLPVGGHPWGVAMSPDGRTAYVTSRERDGKLFIVDTRNPGRFSSIPVGKRPVGIADSPRRARVYVANLGGGTVSMLDASNGAVSTIKVGKGPAGIAVNAQGTRLYVTNYGGDSLSVINIDEDANTVVKTIALPSGPIGVAVDPSGARVYVASYLASRVTVIGTASNTVVDTIHVGSHPAGVALDSSGDHLFVTHAQSRRVSVIDTGQDREIARVPVGSFPFGLEVGPDGKVFVANARDGTISVIDPTRDPANPEVKTLNTHLGAIPVSLGAFLAIDPRSCPAQAPQCDDGDRDTLDSCTPTLGCQHLHQDALEASRANVAALANTYQQGRKSGTVGDSRRANRVGILISNAQGALGASPPDVPSARRALHELVHVLGGDGGIQPQVESRLLDLALASSQQLRTL
jgi:YVTN family beta-propeller protein